MKIDEGKVLLLLTGILSGIVLTSFLLNTKLSPTSFLSYGDYVEKKAEQSKLKSEINNLNANLAVIDDKLNKYLANKDKNNAVQVELNQELKRLQLDYGTTEVSGPGVAVTLRDRQHYFDEFDKMYQFNLVHNNDIAQIVQELINAGAEAVAINGKRYTNRTAVTCVGPIMGLKSGENEEIMSPPFIIEAIGEPETLYEALNSPESYYKMLSSYRELPVGIQKVSNIKMKAAKVRVSPEIIDEEVKQK